MQRRPAGGGLALAIGSAAAFSTSGSFAASLLGSGWSPEAAVVTRIALAAAVLTVPAVIQLRGRWGLFLARGGRVAGYGLVAVAACQLFYFHAVEHLSVGVALLLEYLGSVLVVGWVWLRHGQRPRRLTVTGGLTAIAGLVIVLDVTGSVRVDLAGLGWGLAAAVALAVYFVLSAGADEELPPLAMAWGGMVVGAAVLGLAGVSGLLPMRAATGDVRFAGHQVSWLVPVLGLSVLAAAVAYVTGIAGARLLGPRLASFVGLTEVVFAVGFAWLFVGQLPAPVQLVGGLVIVAGIALLRVDELRAPVTAVPEVRPVG